ncbi:YaaA family protein [Veillonella criceti]|uniref:Protein of uncharacterized function (DUF328) n=1 Tax=Veillonella criceti TaxID=103891 RepID=A0A380NLU3_9FIRM|nr:YaaA family protein [Veillonella criceti]SUP44229.1 Protein of uncharacterised function (DUF328) [Veillonella criceti]
MKILLSPSKTKTLQGTPKAALFQAAMTDAIIDHLQTLTVSELGKALKLAEPKTEPLVAFYQNYRNEPSGTAIESYNGLAFKNLAWNQLSETAQAFGARHIYILSALYGLVSPLSPIKEYRLDLVDRIFQKTAPATGLLAGCKSLYELWKKPVTEALVKEDWLLNLASKEYYKLVDHPRMVTVEFLELKQGVWKQLSTSSKQMRGQLAHYMVAQEATSWHELPQQIGEFTRVTELPTSLHEPLLVEYRRHS